ncbi:HIT family protein [Acinetobacter rongchengensis]|uniref:HIT family protein n=1 Tax=Acinetobacter rongchengensis TaxID=2419601 RepID=A0A3A8EXG5_9GAMM|nr:HIT family protein [Acinetobacter rongchengensis]RKG38858.1 HIT family protein [Acinetobacter rongchengensis]
MSESCIFCKIIKNELPHHLIDSNDNFMAFLTIFPNTLGATVVIPKQHYSSYAFDLDDDVLSDLVLYSKKVAKKLDSFFDDVGRTAMVFEGFGVDHVHAKLFPMHGTKQVHENWQAVNSNVDKYFEQYEGYISSHDFQRADDEALAKLAERIREAE